MVLRRAAMLSVLVAAWGNAVVIVGRMIGEPEWVSLIGNSGFAVAMLWGLRRSGRPTPNLGLAWPHVGRDRLLLVLSVAAVGWSAGWLAAGVFGTEDVSGLRIARLVIGTALAEEVLHRGALVAVWTAAGASPVTLFAANAITFGAWHLAGATHDGFHALEVVGPAAAAVVLLWARLRTVSVLTPAALHLAVNITGLSAVAA